MPDVTATMVREVLAAVEPEQEDEALAGGELFFVRALCVLLWSSVSCCGSSVSACSGCGDSCGAVGVGLSVVHARRPC